MTVRCLTVKGITNLLVVYKTLWLGGFGLLSLREFEHFRLIPYSVVSTGKDVGVIEIVRDSSTIMSIQQKNGIRAAVQMDSLGLYNWIMYHNKDR